MLDLHDLSTWLLAAVAGLAGWVKNEFDKRPTREESDAKQEAILAKLEAMKEDVTEIKSDVKDMRHDINQLYDQ